MGWVQMDEDTFSKSLGLVPEVEAMSSSEPLSLLEEGRRRWLLLLLFLKDDHDAPEFSDEAWCGIWCPLYC